MHDPQSPRTAYERLMPPDAVSPESTSKPVRRIRRADDLANLTPATGPLTPAPKEWLRAYSIRCAGV